MGRLYRILLLFVILLNACSYPIKSVPSKSEMPSNIPNVAELEMRVKQLYEAEITGDWHTWYNMSTLSLKKVVTKKEECSYEEFEKEVLTQKKNGKSKIISWGINKITLREKPNYDKLVVAVEMDVVIQEMSNKPEKIKDQTDYWVYIDNTMVLDMAGMAI